MLALPLSAQNKISEVVKADTYAFSLRANLLRWATLTSDLGIEWRINRNVGILANGSWTSWSWDNKNRRYALWKVSPEVRYYKGNRPCTGSSRQRRQELLGHQPTRRYAGVEV